MTRFTETTDSRGTKEVHALQPGSQSGAFTESPTPLSELLKAAPTPASPSLLSINPDWDHQKPTSVSTITASKMERAFILLMATVVLSVTPEVKAVLTNANNTQFNITRTGCGVTKLCVETPADCDPAGNGTCLFGSVNASTPMPPNGVEMSFQLSGNSSGYIALGLTKNQTEGTTILLICAKINETFEFRINSRNNSDGTLSTMDREVTEIRGTVDGEMIQCEFDVPGLNASSTRNAADTSYVVLLGSGSVNGSTLGPFNVRFASDLLNLADPSSNLSPPASSGNKCGLHSHVLAFLVSILTMSALRTV
ncbi:putative ferric-chelate reductase 1 [Cololabis saira]|uniref:putative ferric-chelate reductase 1 n=1 Tax=Cololabis saira TaxID=129043 RepID=UPI002AD33B86|nr:putative ferric-chelate reductase 1 [Cololabis saira]